MKIAVVCDSGSALNENNAKDHGIFFLPLQILVGDERYLDGVNIQTAQVYQFLSEGIMPTTSLPPMALMEELFTNLKNDGYDAIIAVPLTSGLSSTSEVMYTCAKNIGIEMHVVEIYTTCYLQGYIAIQIKKLVDKGLEIKEILDIAQQHIGQSNTLIIPDDLQHLKRGGRLTPLAATLGGLLKIKPILQLNRLSSGKIDVYDKVRTMKKAQNRAIETFVQQGVDETYLITCLHTNAPEEAQAMGEQLRTLFPKNEIIIDLIGAVISVHTGLGCVGIQFIKKFE